jgi:hypothetical protein
MVKQRPSLTLLAVDEPAKIRPLRFGESKLSDTEDDGGADDADELEGSCDIGETTLCKGSIHINRAGVSFVPKARADLHDGGKHDDDEIEEDEELVRPPKRKVTSICLPYRLQRLSLAHSCADAAHHAGRTRDERARGSRVLRTGFPRAAPHVGRAVRDQGGQ